MASGQVYRAERPNTWPHRPMLLGEDSTCQPGAVHTWPFASGWLRGIWWPPQGGDPESIAATRVMASGFAPTKPAVADLVNYIYRTRVNPNSGGVPRNDVP